MVFLNNNSTLIEQSFNFKVQRCPMTDTQDIESWLKEHKITEVECLVPDMTGNARGKFIPLKTFLQE